MNKQELIKFISKAENIFDVYILLYFNLISKQSSIFNELEGNQTDFNKFRENCSSIFEEKDFDSNLSLKNKNKIVEYLNTVNRNVLLFSYALLTSIDEVFGNKDYRFSKIDYDMLETDEPYYPLNSKKTQRYGYVFFKSKSFLDKFYPPEKFMRQSPKIEITIEGENLIIYDYSNNDYKIEFRNIKHTYLQDIFYKKERINIALIPLTGDAHYLEFAERKIGSKTKIYLKKMHHENQYKNKIIDILDSLKDKEIDVVIFPEMVFSETILLNVKKFLNKNKGCFALVISGTIWKDKKNECITLSGDGIEIARQIKLNPYRTKNIEEDIIINSDNKVISIFDIENFGRCCTPICADFVSSNYVKELIKMNVNVLFVPAFTSILDHFYAYADELAIESKGITFVCNCCIQIINDKDGNKIDKQEDVLFVNVPLRDARRSVFSLNCECKKCDHKDKVRCENHIISYSKNI